MNLSQFTAGGLNVNRFGLVGVEGDEGAEDDDREDCPGRLETRSGGERGSDGPGLRGRLIGGR